jgi:hypothetical protein
MDKAVLSPDGTKIAFSSINRLTVYDTRTRKLSFYDYDYAIQDPSRIAWLPDSSQVLIVFVQNFEPQVIYLCNTPTGQLIGPGIPYNYIRF